MSGPPPKRTEQLIRRNKQENPVDTVTAIGVVRPPDLNLGGTVHPLVVDLWISLKQSAQKKYFEPSDWQYARLTLHVLNDMLLRGDIGAMKLTAVNQMLSSLLMTEAERRRVRIEIERNQDGKVAEVVPISQVYREQLSKPAQ